MKAKIIIKRIVVVLAVFLVALWALGFILIKTGYNPPEKPKPSILVESTQSTSLSDNEQTSKIQLSSHDDMQIIVPLHFSSNDGKEGASSSLEATILTQHNRRDTSGKERWELKKSDSFAKYLIRTLREFRYVSGDVYSGQYLINDRPVEVRVYIIRNGIFGNKMRIICIADKKAN